MVLKAGDSDNMAKENESTMKWKVDITQLKAAMQEAKRAISMANAEFKTATAGMDKWSKSTTGLEAKLQQLNKLLPAQKRELEVLVAQYNDTVKKMGENSSAAHDLRIKIEEQKATITKTETSINSYNKQLDAMRQKEKESSTALGQLSKTIADQEKAVASLKKEYANAVVQYGANSKEAKNLAKQIQDLSGELADNKQKFEDARRSADNLDKSLDDADKSARDAANGGFTVLKGAMANLVADGINAAINGLKRLMDAVIEVGKTSINEYANYEQLVGGVEKIFGDSAKIVEGYADQAYKTAGMSANAYMETVTGFSATLLQGLNGDTAKAARIADKAIQDMSDNANTFGTDIASLQHAYQGFAKGNFTMLDNLKLGYGGTKEEMLRLVKDAGVVADSVKSIDDVTFDQIIEAIHIIQNEMNITGTTSKEAADTIEGSKKSMQASWQNLLKEFAKSDGDIEGAFSAFADSMINYATNLLPRIGELIDNVVTFARQKLEEKNPELLSFIDGIVSGVETAIGAIKGIFDFFVKYGDQIIAVIAGLATATAVYLGYTTALKIMTEGWMALSIVQKIVAAGQAVLNAVMAANPIGIVIALIAGLVAAFIVLWNKSEAFREFWINLWETIKEITGKVVSAISEWFSNLWSSIKEKWDKAKDYFSEKWENIKEVFSETVKWFKKTFEDAWEAVKNVFATVGEFFGGIWKTIKEKFTDIGQKVGDSIGGVFKAAINGVLATAENVLNAPIRAINSLISKIQKVPGLGGLSELNTFSLPRLAQGGVLRRGQIGLLEGSGDEAVIPLDQNKAWIAKVVKGVVEELNISGVKGAIGANIAAMNGSAQGGFVQNQNVTFNQYNTSPKALDRLSIYRDTNSLLFSAKVRLSNV